MSTRLGYYSNIAAAAPDRLIKGTTLPSPPAASPPVHMPAPSSAITGHGDDRHLRTLFAIIGLGSLSLAGLLIWIWLQQHRFDHGVAALGVGSLGAGMLIGRRFVTRMNVGRAVVAASSSILVIVVALAAAGNGTSTLAMVALVAVLIAVPYVDRPTLRRLSIAAWIAAAIVGAFFGLAVPEGARPSEAVIRFLGVCLNMSLALFVVFHLSGRLTAAAQRYRDLVQRVPVGIYRTTPEGRFLDANAAFATMFGFTRPEDVVDVPASDLYADPSDRSVFQKAVESAGVARSVELRARRADGRTFWVRDSAQLVRDTAGRPMYYEGIVEDVTERKHQELRLEHRASVDGLTGLANRTVLVELLDDVLAEAAPDSPVALLFVDLDDFTQVNDRFGHAAGDAALVEAGRRLRLATRDRDVVARFGGDEFAVLLEVPTQLPAAKAVGKRIVDAFREPISVGSDSIVLGASVGVAIAVEPLPSGELTRRADEAMYAAKSGPKVEVFAA